MRRNTITITDSGIVTVPSETQMSISEIADLFGIYYQTVKRVIRKIEKSGTIQGDNMGTYAFERGRLYPDCYGLEMVVATSFQVQSEKAKIFRNWLLRKVTKTEIPEMQITTNQNPMLN